MNNQTYSVRGRRGTIGDLCGYFHVVEADLALKRMRRGWSVEDAVCKAAGEVPCGRKPKR